MHLYEVSFRRPQLRFVLMLEQHRHWVTRVHPDGNSVLQRFERSNAIEIRNGFLPGVTGNLIARKYYRGVHIS